MHISIENSIIFLCVGRIFFTISRFEKKKIKWNFFMKSFEIHEYIWIETFVRFPFGERSDIVKFFLFI